MIRNRTTVANTSDSNTLPDDMKVNAIKRAMMALPESIRSETYMTRVDDAECVDGKIRCNVYFVSRNPYRHNTAQHSQNTDKLPPRCRMPSVARRMLWDVYHQPESPSSAESSSSSSSANTCRQSSTSTKANKKGTTRGRKKRTEESSNEHDNKTSKKTDSNTDEIVASEPPQKKKRGKRSTSNT